jgi:hypothetical protein
MAAKKRKPGDWKAVAAGREKKPRDLHMGHGLKNIPAVTDTGSAAYRRLLKQKSKSR